MTTRLRRRGRRCAALPRARSLERVVSSRRGGGAYRVERTRDGDVSERPLEVRYLGAAERPQPPGARDDAAASGSGAPALDAVQAVPA